MFRHRLPPAAAVRTPAGGPGRALAAAAVALVLAVGCAGAGRPASPAGGPAGPAPTAPADSGPTAPAAPSDPGAGAPGPADPAAGPGAGAPAPPATSGSQGSQAPEPRPFPPPVLRYYNFDADGTAPEGQVTEVSRADLIWVHFTGPLEEPDVRDHLTVDPGPATLRQIQWFEQNAMVQILLDDVPVGGTITVTVKAGLAGPGTLPLDRDYTWRLRLADPTTVTFRASAPGLMQYTPGGGWSQPPNGQVLSAVMPPGPLTLEMEFSRPMDRDAVRDRLAERLGAPDLRMEWPSATRAVAAATLEPAWPHPSIDFYGVRDGRGLPIPASDGLSVRVSRLVPLYRWTPDGGSRQAARVLSDLVPRAGSGATVAGGRLILWDVLGDDGDAFLMAPWVVEMNTGDTRIAGAIRATYHPPVAAWLPGGAALAYNGGTYVGLVPAAGGPEERAGTGAAEPGYIIGMAVSAADGRIALFESWRNEGQERFRGTVDLVILDPAGRPLARLPAASLLYVSEGFPWHIPARWLPDGRLAYVRYPEPAADGAVPRQLALADPAAGTVRLTDVSVHQIWDVSPDGRVLLDGGRLYDPDTGRVESLALPAGPSPDHPEPQFGLFSPDGRWLALSYYQGLAVVDLADGRRLDLGQGYLVGWSPAGELYWLANPDTYMQGF